MVGIAQLKKHLGPSERIEALESVLSEVKGSPEIRNAILQSLIESCNEVGAENDAREYMQRMIIENANRSRDR